MNRQKTQPPIVLAVTNDLVHDNRLLRHIGTLQHAGYRVLFVGRRLKSSASADSLPCACRRFRLFFTAGPFFYSAFNIRLFFFLLFRRASILVANDLDTLAAVWLASRIKKVPIIYDTHEYFTGVPEVEHRRWVHAVWKGIEKRIFPKLTHVITVNNSIASLYGKEYGIPVQVVRNLASRQHINPLPADKLKLPEGKEMIILQGTGLNRGRGVEEAVQSMRYCDEAVLFILGNGPALPLLKKMVAEYSLEERVRFIRTLPYAEMMRYAATARIGLSLDKPDFLNYRLSLPNKIFDYIQAGTPVLASDLPEVKKIVVGYHIGRIVNTHNPEEIARTLREILADTRQWNEWKKNIATAAKELCWEKEEGKLLEIYRKVLPVRV